MRFQPIVCAMTLALAACSTSRLAHSSPCGIIRILGDLIENEKRFSGTPGQAYVVIATDTVLPEGTTETFTFQQVDRTSSTFLPERVSISFTSRTDTGENFHRPPAMAATSMRLAGKRVTPGDYALVYVSNKSLGEPTHCYAEGAPLYRFQEGSISIVQHAASSDAAPTACRAAIAAYNRDPALIQAQVTEVLAGYPEMTAPLVVAPLLGTARCEPGTSRPAGSPCTANDRFSIAEAALP